jgi:RNA-directed DNA polymerase
MSDKELTDLKRMFNAKIRGWIAYYGKYYPSALHRVFRRLNRRLVRWVQQKYKRFRRHQGQAWQWLRRLARAQPDMFAHWKLGMVP